jgi:hypothetical protein
MKVKQGRDYMNNAAFYGGTQITAWYIGCYASVYTPVDGETLTTLLANGTEVTSYTGGARKLLTPDALAEGVWSNAGDGLLFEFPAGGTINGTFITSNPVQGSTTGVLLDATATTAPKAVAAGEKVLIVAGSVLAVPAVV